MKDVMFLALSICMAIRSPQKRGGQLNKEVSHKKILMVQIVRAEGAKPLYRDPCPPENCLSLL